LAETLRKVLIITYYWPPSGGSGVQRWLKFVKYLPEFGWKPVVFTPENPSFDIRDESLLRDVPSEAEVLRFPIWEPYAAFAKLSGLFSRKKSLKPTDLVATTGGGLFQKLAMWIRGNFFVPDPRVFWVRPSVRYLLDYIERKSIRTIITTGPPHSLHLIGLRLKEKNPNLRWLADFRDPWSEWGLLDSLNVGERARRHHRDLEDQVLRKADEIITITPFYKKRFEQLSGRNVILLTNGFDKSDFADVVHTRTNTFMIRHVGIINEKCDPRPLMTVLDGLIRTNKDFSDCVRIEFIGEVHPEFKTFVTSSPSLSARTEFKGNIPHRELLRVYGSSSVLLLVLTGYKDAQGYLPGKLFEYLATGIPVVGIGPENGDAAMVLRESGGGVMIDEKNTETIRKTWINLFAEWKKGTAGTVSNNQSVDKLSRREITRQLADLLGQEMP
jgi:glycosyltransferase involved in cell wall biosynthesis